MTQTLAQIKRYRHGFGWAFLLSIAVLSASALYLVSPRSAPTAEALRTVPHIRLHRPGAPAPVPQPLPEASAPATSAWLTPAMLTAIASLLTSLVSVGGFFLSLRKERYAEATDRRADASRHSRR